MCVSNGDCQSSPGQVWMEEHFFSFPLGSIGHRLWHCRDGLPEHWSVVRFARFNMVGVVEGFFSVKKLEVSEEVLCFDIYGKFTFLALIALFFLIAWQQLLFR